MTSIVPAQPPSSPSAWHEAGLRYHSINFFLRRQFGQRVWKVSLDPGFGCPKRAECVFCDPESYSPGRRLGIEGIRGQLDEGIRRLRVRYQAERFLAYFQPSTNTFAPVHRLRELYQQAIDHPDVVGLIIGTRPDCVPNAVLDLLAELSQRTWLSVEYGLQTIHDRSLDWMRRGHHYDAFLDAHQRSRQRNLHVGAHVILGLPGETRDDMLATAQELARLGLDSVKLHNLYAVKQTPLAEMVASGEVELPERDEYVTWVVDFLEQLPPQCVIDRISGDAPQSYLVGPAWCLDKPAVRAAVEAEFERRDTWQGKHFRAGYGSCSRAAQDA